MTREQIAKIIEQQAPLLKQAGVMNIYLFGSRARGDNRPDSDVDLFVDYNADAKIPSYFKLLEFSLMLEDRLGLPVHLGTRASLDPIIKDQVEKSAVKIF